MALQEIRNHQKSLDQLKADLTLARSSHTEESERYQQDIHILREELGITKNECSDAQSSCNQLKVEVETLTEELEKERKSHDEAVAEVNRRGDELQSQDRLLSDCRQQIILLEGQIEQGQDTNARLESSLESYKQKYQATSDQLGSLENSFTALQDQLVESRSMVRLL